MLRHVALLALVPLAACVSAAESGAVNRLSQDQEQPVLALFDHVLTGYFAEAGANGPKTCATLLPMPLTAGQERQLIERFVRLSAASQCGPGDATVQVYEFSCRDPASCSGWVSRPGKPATHYAMRFHGGAWQFSSDTRKIAE